MKLTTVARRRPRWQPSEPVWVRHENCSRGETHLLLLQTAN